MEAVFLKIFNMSITASWLVLAVIALRFLLKKAPKSVSVVMWALVAIRLILPFSFESILSVIPSTETVSTNNSYTFFPVINSGIESFNEMLNPIISDILAPIGAIGMNPMEIVTRIASIVWITGTVVMLLYTSVSYLIFMRKVRESMPLKDNVYLCDGIGTPFILGIIKPRIYMPSDIDEADIECVIAHERAHLKRRDHLWKPLGFLLLALYWFNPLLWVAYILLCRDIELACDEKVLKIKGAEIKKQYSVALVNCSVPRKMIAACPLAFGEGSVRGRVKSVLSYKKPAFWVIIVSTILFIAVAMCFLTNPVTNYTLPVNIIVTNCNSELAGVSLSIKEIELGNADPYITIEWKNDSEQDVIYSEPFDILFENNGKYVSCSKMGLIFTEPGLILPKNESVEKRYSLRYFDMYKAGNYRFITKADYFSYNRNEDSQLWIDFKIKADPSTLNLNAEKIDSGIKNLELSIDHAVTDSYDQYINLKWENKTDKSIYYSLWCEIEYYENEKYVSCRIKADGGSDVYKSLSPGKSATETYDLSYFDLSKPGKYRMTFKTDSEYSDQRYLGEIYFELVPVPDSENTISEQIAGLKSLYPQYFNLNTSKGLKVYVWPSGNDYVCGLVTKSKAALDSYQYENALKNATTVEEMKLILSTYDIEKSDIELAVDLSMTDMAVLSPSEEESIGIRLGILSAEQADYLTDNGVPRLSVSWASNTKAKMEGYSWNYINKDREEIHVNADSDHPLTHLLDVPEVETDYEKKKDIVLRFGIKPDEVTVKCYDLVTVVDSMTDCPLIKQFSLTVETDGSFIIANRSAEVYLFVVTAKWNTSEEYGGTVEYAFRIGKYPEWNDPDYWQNDPDLIEFRERNK